MTSSSSSLLLVNPMYSSISTTTASSSSSSSSSNCNIFALPFASRRLQRLPRLLATCSIQSNKSTSSSNSRRSIVAVYADSTTSDRITNRTRRMAVQEINEESLVTKDTEGQEEESPPLIDDDDDNDDSNSSKPRRIALFVEPSPFAYISGYKNRFQNFIKHLREMGDEVIVVTTHEGVPQEFHGAKVIGSWSFPCPWYQKVPLSLALSPRIISEVAKFKPDIIHASSPGIMVFGALAIAKMLCVPIVMSYHTHVPIYIPRYTFSWLVKPMWLIIRFLHRAADLTLVPSVAISKDLLAAHVTAANKIRLWNKGVDSDSFHPRYCSHEMRVRLSGGEPEKPLLIHVGRLGVEKSLDFLKKVMDRLPGARIAFIGDGPYRPELEKIFSGMPAVFTGMLQGEELSQAYASGDIFLMPSESETLGFVVLEAMSSGVPVVAARAGGLVDIVPDDQDGKTSFLYTPGDLDDCMSKIQQLLSDGEFREAMGKAARREMEKYDWRAATRKIRNEQYNAAIWFWRKKRAQLLRPIQWLVRRIFRSPEIGYDKSM